jgi:hypothetical protein
MTPSKADKLWLVCKRCRLGIDDDGDGNCAICARWSDEEVKRVIELRLKVVEVKF